MALQKVGQSLLAELFERETDWFSSQLKTAISYDGKLLAAARENNIFVARIREGASLGRDVHQCDETHCNPDEIVTTLAWISSNQSSGLRQLSKGNHFLAVGYDTGNLRIFNDKCELLYVEQFDRDSLLQIKFKASVTHLPIRTPEDLATRPSTTTYSDLILLFPSSLVHIDAKSLLTHLMTVALKSENNEIVNFKKFGFVKQSVANDVICVAGPGETTPLEIAKPQVTQRYIVCGSNPILSCHLSTEDPVPLTAAKLTTMVAKQVTKTVFSFAKTIIWGSGSAATEQSSEEKPKEKAEIPSHRLTLKLSLTDTPREVISLCVDPTGRLAASTDNLGRVMLIDTLFFVAIHMWKGYRDAQCAWIPSAVLAADQTPASESDTSEKHKQELSKYLLVIYAPKRGLLEVWDPLTTTRVCAMNTTINGSGGGGGAPQRARLVSLCPGIGGEYPSSTAGLGCVLLREDGAIQALVNKSGDAIPQFGHQLQTTEQQEEGWEDHWEDSESDQEEREVEKVEEEFPEQQSNQPEQTSSHQQETWDWGDEEN